MNKTLLRDYKRYVNKSVTKFKSKILLFNFNCNLFLIRYKACKQELKESKRQYNLSGYWMKKVNEDAPTTRNTFGYSSYMTPNKN